MLEDGVMLDARLVGYWSDEPLYLGAMEATDIAFRADGTGWTYWSNAGGFEIVRFGWQATGPSLVLHMREYVGGSWHLDGGTVIHQQREQSARDEQVPVGYEITAGRNVFGDPATVLQFDRHVLRGVSSNRFALQRELADDERDPACNSDAPPGVT